MQKRIGEHKNVWRMISFVLIAAMVLTMLPAMPASAEAEKGTQENPYLFSELEVGKEYKATEWFVNNLSNFHFVYSKSEPYVAYYITSDDTIENEKWTTGEKISPGEEAIQFPFDFCYAGDSSSKAQEILDGVSEITISKNAAIEEITRAAGENPSSEVENLVNEAKENITNAETFDEIAAAKEEGLNKIREQQEKEALSVSKNKAIEELIREAGENPSEKVQEIVNNYTGKINEATTQEAVEAAKNEGITKIQNQKDAEDPLTISKNAAKDALDAAAGTEPSQEVKDIVNEYKGKIDAAGSQDAVEIAKNEGIDKIKNQKEKEDALTASKNAAKKELEDAAGTNASSSVNEIVKKYQDKIDEATTQSDVENAKNEGLDAIRNQQTEESKDPINAAKKEAKDELDKAAGDNPSDEVKQIVDNAKSEIDKATTQDGIDKAKQDGLDKIKDQQDKENTDPLSASKNAAKEELNKAAGDKPSDEVKKIVEDAVKAIDSATTQDGIDKAKQDGLDKIKAQQDKENEDSLSDSKNAAKDELDKAAGTNPSDEVKKIVEDAKNAIDKAATQDEIDKAKQDGLNKIKDQQAADSIKYKAYDPKKDNVLVVGDRIEIEYYYPNYKALKVKKWKYEIVSGDKTVVKKSGKYFLAKKTGIVTITPCDKKGNPIPGVSPVTFKVIKPVVEKKVYCRYPGETVDVMKYIRDNELYYPTEISMKSQKISTLSANIVTAGAKSGTSTIRIKYGRKSYTLKVLVKIPKVKTTAKVKAGKTIKFTCSNYVDGVQFVSSDNTIATVTNDGRKIQVTGIKEGPCEIKVLNNGVECGKCTVTVK